MTSTTTRTPAATVPAFAKFDEFFDADNMLMIKLMVGDEMFIRIINELKSVKNQIELLQSYQPVDIGEIEDEVDDLERQIVKLQQRQNDLLSKIGEAKTAKQSYEITRQRLTDSHTSCPENRVALWVLRDLVQAAGIEIPWEKIQYLQ